MPSPKEIIREAVIVIAGAMLAAFVMKQLPSAKQHIKDAWN